MVSQLPRTDPARFAFGSEVYSRGPTGRIRLAFLRPACQRRAALSVVGNRNGGIGSSSRGMAAALAAQFWVRKPASCAFLGLKISYRTFLGSKITQWQISV
jgi:hypothetical protein